MHVERVRARILVFSSTPYLFPSLSTELWCVAYDCRHVEG